MERNGNAYNGVDNLEIMSFATNYNCYLQDLVLDNIPSDRVPGNNVQSEDVQSESVAGDIKSNVNILDFGSGIGTFCGPLLAKGFEVKCVELDVDLRRSLIEKGVDCCAEIGEVADNSQDYIYSFNVLEHIEDDLAAANELNRVLKSGGTLLIYVPAFQCLYSAMDRKVGHYRRYRLNNLNKLLYTAGFNVRESMYVDSLGFIAALLYKWFGTNEGSISKAGIILYDRVAFPLSRIIDFFSHPWFGKNALVIAVKS